MTKEWLSVFVEFMITIKFGNLMMELKVKWFMKVILLIEYETNNTTNINFTCAEIYFIIALWGIEFAINMGGSEIVGYEEWLKNHNNQTPLSCEKNF